MKLTAGQTTIITYPATDVVGCGTILEIGPGRGDFLFHLAVENPERVICGIEIKGKRFDKLIARTEKRGLKNVRLVMADAGEALPELFSDGSILSIYINFPDPWPKRRHTKHRLLSHDFLTECSRVLTTSGTLNITTDSEDYAKVTYANLQKVEMLGADSLKFMINPPDTFPTFFCEKWKREGRTIHHITAVRT